MAQALSHPLAPHRGPPSIALPPPASPAVPSSTIPLTALQSHPAPIPTALAATPEDSPSNRPSPTDGDRLEQRLSKDKVKILEQAFMEAADNALPHPMEDAYLEACHTNNMEWKMCIYGAGCSEIILVQVRGSGMLKDSACHELDKIRSLKRPYIKRVQDRHKETVNCLKRNAIEMEGYIRPPDVVIIVSQYIPCSDDQHSDGVADDHPNDSLFSPTYHHHKITTPL
ncbi:hypothetical protein Zm00014a_036989 [Zea mays]|uniref:Uncharacterized protein n=1 Tax=Zea mays TaxID=4577 RepID=A0A3L6G0H6_MAIZE|nr:hypothetical protein Zm00014a_036989 [Zea mays]